MVTLLPVANIVPVGVPLRVPPPVALLNAMVVLLVGLDGLPLVSCDCTVTLKPVPAIPVLGTDVSASLVAAAATTVIVPESTEVNAPDTAWIFALPTRWPVKVALFALPLGTRSAATTPPVMLVSDQVAGMLPMK